MTKNEVIKSLTDKIEIKSVYNEIVDFLNGKTEKINNVNKKNLRYINNFEMKEFMKRDDFLESEAGKTLLKYFEYMYNNFPDELSYQFSNFPLKYKIYKFLGFSDEFVKKDFENNSETKNNNIFWNNCKCFLKYFENLADSYIKNYDSYSDNFLIKLGILITVKNVILKCEKKSENIEEIQKLDNIFIRYIADKIERYKINKIFSKHLDNKNFKRYFQNMKILNIEKVRKYMEKSFFEILSENKAVSEVVSEGIELFIMFSEIEFSSTNNNYYYRNKMFEKLEKNFKKYNFSQKQRLYLLVNYGLNVIFNNFERSKKMYDLFLDTIKEDLESAKEFLNDNLEENKLEYSFLLHFFIRENLINKKDQQRLLAMSEEILIRDLKELFEEKAWKWHPSKFRNLGFLEKENIDWESITIECLGYKPVNILAEKDKIIFSLFKYSDKYKKVFQFLINSTKEINLFKDIFLRYDVIYGIFGLRDILNEMWNYGLRLDFINRKYFEYIERKGFDNKNNKIWMEFLHEHEKELYKIFEKGVELSKEIENYVNILYLKDNGFDYSELPKLLLNANEYVGHQIEKILRRRLDAKNEIEKIVEKQIFPASHIAERLVKYWDNVEAQKGLRNLMDSKEIFEYADSICLEKHEENAVFSAEVDYGMIRIKDSDKKIPAKLMKFYISEYILAKDIRSIDVCNKIEEIAQKEDLRKFVKKIFGRWKVHMFNPKYKNIFIPLIKTASIKQLDEMIEIVDMLVSEYNKIAVAAYGIRVLSLREEVKQVGILLNSFILNYKDKRIKMAANEALELISQKQGMTRDELNDILVPDFNFEMDRTKIFTYGDKRIKIELDIAKIPQKVILYDENNNKEIKSFPKVSKKRNIDNEILEEYKRELKYIKKQLKEISSVQRNNLLKALFTQRKWKAEKWKEIFIKNPIMQKFAIFLLWKEIDEKNKTVSTFRYTENNIFESINEKEYQLNQNNFVNLVYFPELKEEEREYWKMYFNNKKILQPINQINIPFYKLTEEKKEKIEILDYNEKEFLVKTLRKESPKLDFEINYGNDGKGYGIHYIDKNTDITAVILTNSFFSGDYTKKLKIEKIVFFKGSPVVQYEKTLESQDIKLLKLKEIPKRILSLVCCMIEILSSEGNN